MEKRSVGVVKPSDLCEILRVSVCFLTQVCEGNHPAETFVQTCCHHSLVLKVFPRHARGTNKKQIPEPYLQADLMLSFCGHHTTKLLILQEVCAVTLR